MFYTNYLSLLIAFTGFIGLIRSSYSSNSNNITKPEQIHVALSGSDFNGYPSTYAISWMNQLKPSDSTVKYGIESGKYIYESKGYATSYYETWHNHVVLNNLNMSTYYYIVGSTTHNVWSEEKTFKFNPYVNAMSFAVYADLGIVNGKSSIDYLTKIKSDVDLYWHGGDVSYADDSFLHKGCLFKFCYEETWDNFMNSIETFASNKPYMVAPGNHEADCHDPACLADKDRRTKLSNFTAYNTRFRMPSTDVEGGGALNMHYSFNYGLAHFISIDTETGYPGSAEETKYVLPCGGFTEQLKWLENDLALANKNRNLRPWIFVQGHHPLYQGNSTDVNFQNALEKLFYDYKVDIYFAGHIHSYERTWPIYANKVEYQSQTDFYNNPISTTYLMIGGSGNDEMKEAKNKIDPEAIEYDPSPSKNRLSKLTKGDKKEGQKGPQTVTVDVDYFGIGIVDIINSTDLLFKYIRTSTGEVYDSFTLRRYH